MPSALHAQGSDNAEVIQTPAASPTANVSPAAAAEPVATPIDKRIFGVLPNYRTASSDLEGSTITPKQKMTIAAKDSFDYPLVLVASAFAGLDQISNDDPSFGQGVKGYAHRLGAWYLDESMGNMMTEGIFPALLHQDPRYFRIGPAGGTIWHRATYAMTRVIITDKDGGRKQFNFSEWLGNASAVAISQAYHPDNRTAVDATEFLFEQVATDAFSQVLKEFWPDIKRKFFKK